MLPAVTINARGEIFTDGTFYLWHFKMKKYSEFWLYCPHGAPVDLNVGRRVKTRRLISTVCLFEKNKLSVQKRSILLIKGFVLSPIFVCFFLIFVLFYTVVRFLFFEKKSQCFLYKGAYNNTFFRFFFIFVAYRHPENLSMLSTVCKKTSRVHTK